MSKGMKPVEVPEGAILLNKIEIVHYMVEDDVVVMCLAQDSSGEFVDTITKLGMLEMAKNFVIQEENE